MRKLILLVIGAVVAVAALGAVVWARALNELA